MSGQTEREMSNIGEKERSTGEDSFKNYHLSGGVLVRQSLDNDSMRKTKKNQVAGKRSVIRLFVWERSDTTN